MIDQENYEQYLVLYTDGELTEAEQAELELFLASNPGAAADLDVFTQTRLEPDTAVVYAGKTSMLKQEDRKGTGLKLPVFKTRHYAVAAGVAALLLFGAVVIWDSNNPVTQPQAIVKRVLQDSAPEIKQTAPAQATPAIAVSEQPQNVPPTIAKAPKKQQRPLVNKIYSGHAEAVTATKQDAPAAVAKDNGVVDTLATRPIANPWASGRSTGSTEQTVQPPIAIAAPTKDTAAMAPAATAQSTSADARSQMTGRREEETAVRYVSTGIREKVLDMSDAVSEQYGRLKHNISTREVKFSLRNKKLVLSF